jgi:phosphonate transport system substrate-binding protein
MSEAQPNGSRPSAPGAIGVLIAVWVVLSPSGLADSPPGVGPEPKLARGELRIGLIPEINVFEQVRRYEPLADHLAARLGLPVSVTIVDSYGSILDSLERREIEAAFMGSFVGALAILQLDAEPLARPVRAGNISTYSGYLFARVDAHILTADQMRGTRLALVDRATSAGYIFPLAYFQRHGIVDLEAHFSRVRYCGSHDAAILEVLRGEAEVGTAKNSVYERLRRSEPRIDRELRILEESSQFPSNGLLVRSDLGTQLKHELRNALLSLDRSKEGKAVLRSIDATKFIPTTRDDFEPVLRLATEAKLDLRTFRIANP